MTGAATHAATPAAPKQVMLLTGLSGAGKTTALKTLEDLGWETIDNFPVRLVEPLLATPRSHARGNDHDPPLALGFDSRTRNLEPEGVIAEIKRLQYSGAYRIATLYLDCSGGELERRFAETRRRHPLAIDRPASEGIAFERALLEPFRRWADHVIDTTQLNSNDLQRHIREQFALAGAVPMTVTLTSFGFSRGVPNTIDTLFDVRFLNNPFWEPELKPMTGQDDPVARFIASDPAYDEAMERFRELLLFLLPHYAKAGKAYVNVGIGCTGGRHRSVHVAEALSEDLRRAGFAITVRHRNLTSRPIEALEAMPGLPADPKSEKNPDAR